MQQGSTEMDMDLDVPAAKGMKRPAADAVEDLDDDDEERRLEEQLRTKVPKANFWAYAYPPHISALLQKGRLLKIRTEANIARTNKVLEESARRCRDYLAAAAAAGTSG
ncbi:hypothetical protein C2845_PM11G01120 [Panicum miliaceum]|uniref:Uncharacterized protein n=1 Tax=Panicum miliaceum TaxID=4540 RepID=A0A3L6RV26_PANMI|nr:hypothetical protein C2845_PM11G01120 [Panicum miliaceum]